MVSFSLMAASAFVLKHQEHDIGRFPKLGCQAATHLCDDMGT